MQQIKELKIDPELQELLPPLIPEEYKQLEKNILENGFDKNFPIMEWNGFIVDGHNRYQICKKHGITDYTVGTLAYKTKEEVMEWMLDIQLGRRNLSPIQRIAVAEKYRPFYEKQAKRNQSMAGGDKKSLLSTLTKAIKEEESINVREKLAEKANVATGTYSKGKKILDSSNSIIKEKVLSGEMSINAGYNELMGKDKSILPVKKEPKPIREDKDDCNSSQVDLSKPEEQSELSLAETLKQVRSNPKPKIGDDIKQICKDIKTEKTREYRESMFNYKINIIECMNAGFNRYYDGFVSILNDMENRVTKEELKECINNAENLVEQMLIAIEAAKNTTIKKENE